jgi:hypothetical protein
MYCGEVRSIPADAGEPSFPPYAKSTLIWPLALGSGKLGTPCERMQSTYERAASYLAAVRPPVRAAGEDDDGLAVVVGPGLATPDDGVAVVVGPRLAADGTGCPDWVVLPGLGATVVLAKAAEETVVAMWATELGGPLSHAATPNTPANSTTSEVDHRRIPSLPSNAINGCGAGTCTRPPPP